MSVSCRSLVKFFFPVLLLLAAAGCDKAGEAEHPQRAALEAALSQAFDQQRDPFVIIEGECDCFVQFMHDNGWLYYDFPNADLAESEQARAQVYHREQGIEEVVIEDIDPATLQAFQLRTWQRAYSREQVAAAADAAILALYRIYDQHQGSKFILIKGWE